MNRHASTWMAGLLLAAPLALLVPSAQAGVHIGIELAPPIVVPPPVYYGPPAEYYSPPPPVYYGPGVVYGDGRWNYDGDYHDRDRGWAHDRWHDDGRRGDHDRDRGDRDRH